MPYEFHVDHDSRLIRKRVWGLYDDNQANESTAQFSLIKEHAEYDELHDLTGITSYEVSPETVANRARNSVAAEDEGTLRKKVAIVVPSALVHGMTRMYMAYHDGSKENIQIFSDLKLANSWLA